MLNKYQVLADAFAKNLPENSGLTCCAEFELIVPFCPELELPHQKSIRNGYVPHLKIYSKLPVGKQGNRSVLQEGMEGSNEVNDGRKACIDQKLCPPLPEEGQEGEGEVLTEFTQMTGYNRCYGAYLLRHQGKRIRLSPKLVAVGDIRKKAGGQRARKYDQKVLQALKIIWAILDYLCGKRLAAILPEVVPILQRHGELKVDASTQERLIQISAATIDRLLAPERRKHRLKGRCGDQAGNRCSNTRFRSSVSPTGKRIAPVLWKWTWWAMREVGGGGITVKPWM